ncbi:hypothetical protein DERP_001044 [Dermatophagoides pteronyssinus]|uniref:B-box type zinc finger protein ncl-1-like n=1 Tax=Dermatophagoides pteronyssinus TaxID=6956 RepID=A0ABQ8JDD8_DERPT|nr:hypothetical protein DERP_001044 [Dermatophagoides pteronyssinus]
MNGQIRNDPDNQENTNRTSILMQDMFSSLQISDVTSTNEPLFCDIPQSQAPTGQPRSGDFRTRQMNQPCCDLNDNEIFSRVPMLTSIPCNDQDYPFLHKIFQILFANPDLINCAFFNPSHDDSQMSEQMSKSKCILYQLIVKQLGFDGHDEIAHALMNKVADPSEISILQQREDTLYKLFNILFYIEIRSKTDERFSNFLNWFFSNNVDTGFPSSQPNSMNVSATVPGPGPVSTNAETSIQPSFSRAPGQFSSVGTNLLNSQVYRSLDSSSVIYETESDGPKSLLLNDATVGRPKPLNVTYKFGQIGTGPGCLDTPHGFCLGPNEDIVIADTNNHRICVFSFDGKFKFSFGEYGTENGKLHQPRKIAMLPPAILRPEDPKPVYIICDRGSKRSRMQMFSIEGNYMGLIDMPPMDIVSGLTTTQDRHIIVVDSVRSGLIAMNEFGDLLNWFTCSPHMMEPSDIAFHNKHFYICDFKGHNICVFNVHGVLVRRLSAKMLRFPNGIDVTAHGDIICGDSHGNRFHISVFNEEGNLIGDYECPFIKVSRCCGLRISKNGYFVTLAKNNNHAVVIDPVVT